DFDIKLDELIKNLKDDDLLMITADHGNDPTYRGTDHTREQVPLLAFSKTINDGKYLGERDSFADIGETILNNFNLQKDDSMIGKPIKELLK
ncbi:MAG: phosphopentomutase, partial [Bacilli bacterium]